MNKTTSAYVFAIPGTNIVKVGHTSRTRHRLYNLRWGSEAYYAPDERWRGDFICVVEFPDVETARAVERKCQHVLRKFRIHPRGTGIRAGAKSEWFDVSRTDAADALQAIAERTGKVIKINNLARSPLFFP